MKNMTFVLDGHNPVEETDTTKWGEWYEHAQGACQVGLDQIGDTRISTIFLGVNYNWQPEGPPVLFETMVFGPDGPNMNIVLGRYSTWEQAEAGHAAVVAATRG